MFTYFNLKVKDSYAIGDLMYLIEQKSRLSIEFNSL